jgi:hypothetical protein
MLEENNPFEDWAEYQVIGDDVFWFDVNQSTKIHEFCPNSCAREIIYLTDNGRFFSLSNIGAEGVEIWFTFFTKKDIYEIIVQRHTYMSPQERQLLISQLNISNG